MRVHHEARRTKKTQNLKRIKITPPNENGCIRILTGIPSLTDSWLDNTSM